MKRKTTGLLVVMMVLLMLACTVHIGLAIFFVYAVSRQPPIS